MRRAASGRSREGTVDGSADALLLEIEGWVTAVRTQRGRRAGKEKGTRVSNFKQSPATRSSSIA